MLYEVRVYAIPPGRSADIETRMLGAVPALFREHGFRAVAHWTALAGPDLPAFIYVLEWSDAAVRDAGWTRFYADERWWSIRADSNAGSELVERYGLWLMRPNRIWTDPFPPLAAAMNNELHELVVFDVAIGQAAAVAAVLESAVLPAQVRAGARVLAVLDMVAGPRVPATALVLAWPDFAARTAGHAAVAALGTATAVLGRHDIHLLRPVLEPLTTFP